MSKPNKSESGGGSGGRGGRDPDSHPEQFAEHYPLIPIPLLAYLLPPPARAEVVTTAAASAHTKSDLPFMTIHGTAPGADATDATDAKDDGIGYNYGVGGSNSGSGSGDNKSQTSQTPIVFNSRHGGVFRLFSMFADCLSPLERYFVTKDAAAGGSGGSEWGGGADEQYRIIQLVMSQSAVVKKGATDSKSGTASGGGGGGLAYDNHRFATMEHVYQYWKFLPIKEQLARSFALPTTTTTTSGGHARKSPHTKRKKSGGAKQKEKEKEKEKEAEDYTIDPLLAKKVADSKQNALTHDQKVDWSRRCLIMVDHILRVKCSAEPFRTVLLESGDRPLVHYERYGTTPFWGIDTSTGRGYNVLGRMLMHMRAELRSSAGGGAATGSASAGATPSTAASGGAIASTNK